MACRYDIRFYQEGNGIRVIVNDKLRQHESLKGIIPTPVKADLANSLVNDLTDAMRRMTINWEEIPEFIENWLEFLA
jgi:hypothetical protein